MGMFSGPYTYYNNPSSQYQLIGGAYYVPGTAAAKKAAQLYAAMPKQVSPTAAAASILAPYAPKPSTPSYPVGNPGASRTGGGASLTGAPGMFGQGAFGLVPQVPSPVATAGEAIGGNVSNMPALGNLGTQSTKLAADLAQMPFQQNLPGYGGMIGTASQGIQSNLEGVIDPNEWEQLQTRMAERGTNVGITPASPNFSTALMKALDQSIRERQTLGQEQLNRAIARTPTGQPFNIAGQQVSPTDVQAARYAANLYAAAPDPTQAAQANLDMLLRAIEAGRAGGMGGVGGGGFPGGGGGGVQFVPIRGGGGGGYPMMPYAGMGSSGWSGIVNQPFYRTTAPGEEAPMYPWTPPGEIDVNSGENIPFSPYEYDYTYQPEPDLYNPYEYDYTYQPEP